MRSADFFRRGVTLKQLSDLYGIPRRTLDDWTKEPDHPAAIPAKGMRSNYYPLKAHVQFVVSKYRKKSTDPSLGKLPAELALLEAKAKRERLRAQREEGEAVLVEDVLDLLVRREVAARNALQSLSQRLAPRLAELSDPHDIAELLTQEINGAIAQLPKQI
jgi:phage terminase Nu1 subunit (DNA packaging protein)